MKLTEQINDVLKIVDVVNHSTHMEESFGVCVELAKDMFSSPCVAVILLDEQTEDIYIRTARGLSYTFLKEFRRPMGQDVMAEILRTQNPILINELSHDSKFYKDLKLENDFGSVLLTPITYEQHSAGILYICHPEKNHFQQEDRTLFAILGHILGFAVQKERLQTMTRRLATMDEKAHILTYTHFRERLQYEILRAREFNYSLSLILFDIDFYRRYRELYGEKAGEELYQKIVDLMKTELDGIDLIGRHGLDEIIICRPQSGISQSRELAKRMLDIISQQEFEKGTHISLSGGIVGLSNRQNDLVNMMSSVRTALLQSQRGGRNQVSVVE